MFKDGIGQSGYKTNRGFLKPDSLIKKNPSRNVSCSDAHRKNPNFAQRKEYSNGTHGIITKEERHRVNTSHRLTDQQAVQLPMRKKLARHFAQNACDNAMEKLVSLFDSSFTGDFDV